MKKPLPFTQIDNLQFINQPTIQVARNADYEWAISRTLTQTIHEFCTGCLSYLATGGYDPKNIIYDGKVFYSKDELTHYMMNQFAPYFLLEKVRDIWFRLQSDEWEFFLKIPLCGESAFEQHLWTHVTQQAGFEVIEPILAVHMFPGTQNYPISRNLQKYVPGFIPVIEQYNGAIDNEWQILKWLRTQIQKTGDHVNDFIKTHPDYSPHFQKHSVIEFAPRNTYLNEQWTLVYFDVLMGEDPMLR